MVELEPLMVEGEGRAGGFGDGVGRGRVLLWRGAVSGLRDGQTQSIWRRLQFPQLGRTSSHLTRLDLHLMHPFRDLRWPTLAGRLLPSESAMAVS